MTAKSDYDNIVGSVVREVVEEGISLYEKPASFYKFYSNG